MKFYEVDSMYYYTNLADARKKFNERKKELIENENTFDYVELCVVVPKYLTTKELYLRVLWGNIIGLIQESEQIDYFQLDSKSLEKEK